MTTFNDSDANVAFLADLLRFEPDAIRAWLRCEGQEVANPTNPLNIRSDAYGAIGSNSAGFAVYPDVQTGMEAVNALLQFNAPLFGYDRVLAQRGTGNAYEQARAVELSDWAAGHYGATALSPGCIARQIEEPAMRLNPGITFGGVTTTAATTAYNLEGAAVAVRGGWFRNVVGASITREPVGHIPAGAPVWHISVASEEHLIAAAECSPFIVAEPMYADQVAAARSQLIEQLIDLNTVLADEQMWSARLAEWGTALQSHGAAILATDKPVRG